MDDHANPRPPSRLPLLAPTLALLAGIVCGYQFPDGLILWILALALPLFFLLRRLLPPSALRSPPSALRSPPSALPPPPSALRLPLFAFILGAALAARDVIERDRICTDLLATPGKTTLVGRIASDVAIKNLKGRGARYEFALEEARHPATATELGRLPVRIRWYGAKPQTGATTPQPGEKWEFGGALRPVCTRDGLLFLNVTTSKDDSRLLEAPDATTWKTRLGNLRAICARRLGRGIDDWPVVPDLVRAILLGCRRSIPQSIRQVFADAGTVHVFAISGLHIVMIATLFAFVLTALGIGHRQRIFLLAPAIIAYTVLTGARPSAIRACLMVLLYYSAPLFNRRPSAASALCAAAILVHLYQPALIFDVGSLLSFAVMTGLVAFCHPFCAFAQRLLGVHALAAASARAESLNQTLKARTATLAVRILRYEANAFGVALAAWISSIPLTAVYFERFTPGGLVANLVIGICSWLTVSGALLSLVCGIFSPFLAAVFGNAAGLGALLMVKASHLAAALPGGSFEIDAWPAAAVWSWYLGLVVLALVLRRRADARRHEEVFDL